MHEWIKLDFRSVVLWPYFLLKQINKSLWSKFYIYTLSTDIYTFYKHLTKDIWNKIKNKQTNKITDVDHLNLIIRTNMYGNVIYLFFLWKKNKKKRKSLVENIYWVKKFLSSYLWIMITRSVKTLTYV